MRPQSRPTLPAQRRARGARKSEVRALRRGGLVPGSLFGHGEPVTVQVPARALEEYLRHHAPGGILNVELDGKKAPALLRELDRDPLTGRVLTVGFQRVGLDERIRAAVPIVVTGEEALTKEGLVLQRQLEEIEVMARVDRLPEGIAVDVTGFQAGDAVRLGDLTFPAGVEPTMKDAELPVLIVTAPTLRAEAEVEVKEAAAPPPEAAAAPAEGAPSA
jgi:large subunit ribosomal protein L25